MTKDSQQTPVLTPGNPIQAMKEENHSKENLHKSSFAKERDLSSQTDESKSKINESLLMRALRREPVSRTPVWIMRQAGRYLPEYRAIRQQAGDFLNLCKSPEKACEVALQPLTRFNLDAAILFSDILTIPDAMGLGLYFSEGEGPIFKKPLQSPASIENLQSSHCSESLGYVMDAVRLIRYEMPDSLPLIGFSGSPWTLACYMIEGRGSRDFKQAFELLYNDPLLMHCLLNKLTQAITAYLEEQIKAGVDVLMLFDTWGGLLTTLNYPLFSLNYMKEIIGSLKAKYPSTPIILFTKGGGQWLETMSFSGCDAIGLDWTTDLKAARIRVNNRVALQGNLDPAVLRAKPEVIRQEVAKVLEGFGFGQGHVFNLGHGITPDIPPEHVEVMIEAIHEYSPKYHERN